MSRVVKHNGVLLLSAMSGGWSVERCCCIIFLWEVLLLCGQWATAILCTVPLTNNNTESKDMNVINYILFKMNILVQWEYVYNHH